MHVSNENCLLIFSLVVPMQKWLFLEKRKMCGIKSAETAMYDVSNKWKKRSSTFKKRRTMNAPPTDKKYERVIKMSSNCYVSVKVANGVFVFSECQKDPGEQFQINDLFERERYWWGKIRWPYEWIFWFRVKWYNDPELKSPANEWERWKWNLQRTTNSLGIYVIFRDLFQFGHMEYAKSLIPQ